MAKIFEWQFSKSKIGRKYNVTQSSTRIVSAIKNSKFQSIKDFFEVLPFYEFCTANLLSFDGQNFAVSNFQILHDFGQNRAINKYALKSALGEWMIAFHIEIWVEIGQLKKYFENSSFNLDLKTR